MLVLGSSGFLGRQLVLTLKERGFEVLGASRSGRGASAVQLDTTNSVQLAELFTQKKFDVVYNCVAKIDQHHGPGKYLDLFHSNTNSCLAVADAILHHAPATALIHIGTNAEYGTAPLPHRFDSVPAPTSGYGVSKLAATIALQAQARTEKLRVVVARPFFMYGPGASPQNFLELLLAAAKGGIPLKTTRGEQTRDFIHVRRAAEQLADLPLALPEKAWSEGSIVNICTGHERTLASVWETVGSSFPALRLEVGALPYRAGELMRSVGVPWRETTKTEADGDLVQYITTGV